MSLAPLAWLTLAAQTPPPIVVPPAPPVERRLLAWMPGEVRCDGQPVTAVALRPPQPALAFRGREATAPVIYRFRLDENGRPLSIEREGARYAPWSDDVGPSLAASRFGPGPARRACAITYTARSTAYADTPLADLIAYTLAPAQGRLPREGWASIFPAAATCDDALRPGPLVQVFPSFDKLPGTPGVRDWTMLAYDLDAKGAPTRVNVLASTGNRALDAAGRAALAKSRYTNGPKTGCRYPFWKTAPTLAAPPAPEPATLRAAGATCPASVTWAKQPPLVFPEPWRRRSIEGWAVIGFDLAPWGATGEVKVLASEPAAEFGQAAAQLVRGATVAPSPTGYAGCVERVRFEMGRPGVDADTGAPGRPLIAQAAARRSAKPAK